MVDQFKKQVMFLHPEPALMEPCARQLGEEFSVHMAASGTEALTTLGITPIDVIICAQDLPGMSGQEALKEAKKRSPDTRGILIASKRLTDSDKAALVNARHLNQILAAESTPAEICAAIINELDPNATQSLPQPANDFSAGPRAGTADRTDTHRVEEISQTGQFRMLQADIPVLEPGTPDEVAPAAQNISEVEIVVLTNDASFLKTIRAATGSSHVVNHAPNLQEGVDIVREGRSGVLITDAAVAVKDVETITAKLRKHMPSLVTIVAGRREDGEKMMGLISDGLVYRFLLKPISPGRSRLAIEASAKKHLTLVNTDVPLTPSDVQEKMTETGIIKGVTFDSGLFRTTDVRQTNIDMPSLDEDDVETGFIGSVVERIGIVPALITATVIVLGIVALFSIGGDDESPASSAPVQNAATPPATQPDDQPAGASRFEIALQSAQSAVSSGNLYSPADNNAVMHFAQAAALQRDNQQVRAALDDVLVEVFSSVERNLLEDDLPGAQAALQTLNTHVPGHPRLAFFNRQLSKELARRDLGVIEQAIAAGDIATAQATLNSLQASDTVDPAIIDALSSRISSQAASATVPELLDLANARVGEGKLTEPFDDSASFYYQAALDIEPENAVARQGMTFIGSMLISQIKTLIARGDYQAAAVQLQQAETTGANSIELASLRQQISALAAADRRPVSRPAPSQPAPSANSVETQTSESVIEDDNLSALREATPVAPPPVAGSDAASESAASTPERAAVSVDESASEAPAEVERELELVQINYEAPRYPRTAQRRGIEGWADVQFVVQADGTTTDVVVIDSSPGSTFDDAAIEAVSAWRYEPLNTDDPTVTSRARVRLEFNLEN